MGIEYNTQPEKECIATDHPFNFVSLGMPYSSSPGPWTRPNFAPIEERVSGEESEILDLSVPIQAPCETPLEGRTGTNHSPAEIAGPINKYDAEVARQIGYLDSEANFSNCTRDALGRDSDKYPPVRNELAGTTTFALEQLGLTDRGLPDQSHRAEHYKRLVTIEVPDQAASLKDCKFVFQGREKIDEKEFYRLVDRVQKRQCDQAEVAGEQNRLVKEKDMLLYTHGIRTGAEGADFQALALQLTQGHCVINVDWKSTPPSEEKLSLSEAYKNERRDAAQSYARFETAIDKIIDHIGADHTDMIAFSHGAMFDTRYLQHRQDSHAPLLQQVIFSHPDVPRSVLPQPDKNGKLEPASRLYAQVSKQTHIIGSTEDLALVGAAYSDTESNASHSWMAQFLEKSSQMPLHERIGNGKKISRELVAGHGGTYVMEIIPQDKKDPTCHFINYQCINTLINGNRSANLIATENDTTRKVPAALNRRQ